MPHGVRTALLLRLGHRVLYGETEACGDETSVRTCTAINCASGIGSVLDAHRTASASSGCHQTWILTRNQRMHTLQVAHRRPGGGTTSQAYFLSEDSNVHGLLKLYIVYLSTPCPMLRSITEHALRCDRGRRVLANVGPGVVSTCEVILPCLGPAPSRQAHS